MTDDGQPHKQSDDDSSKDDMQARVWPELGWVDLGSEPYWMQDIRLAQREIERQRAKGPTPES